MVAGLARGIKLKTLDGIDTRPTKDMVKEAMFSMLTPHLQDAVVLDLFGGSGSLGIEALSRGAKKAIFFDTSRYSCDIIRDNLVLTKLQSGGEVHCKDPLQPHVFCKLAGHHVFDIVFLDPPYGRQMIQKALELLLHEGNNAGNLRKGSLIVAEHKSDEMLQQEIPGLCWQKTKKYGLSSVTLYEKT